MNDDATLLQRYTMEGSQTAFTELVHRHVDLVYHAAMRRTGSDPHRATEVAQQVFTSLARNAGKLSHHTVLPAWLHTATRNAALNLMISEQRRLSRETEAMTLEPTMTQSSANPDWERIGPLLDSAIDELPEADRAAVVLRFLERRPFAEIGRALQVSEDAARMRTDRALDKLRSAMVRRGITSTAAALGAMVSSQPLLSAPSGLASAIATQAIAGAGVGFIGATFASFMTTKLITTALLSALVAFGAGAYVGLKHDASVSETKALPIPADQSQLIASLRRDNQRLADQVSGLNADVTRLNAAYVELGAKRAATVAVPKPKSPNIELPLYELQRSVLNNLRQIDAARDQYALENGRPAGSIRDLVGVKRFIKTVRTVGGEDYTALSMVSGQPMTVTTPDGINVTYDPKDVMTTRPEIPPEVVAAEKVQVMGRKVQPSAMKAIEAYRAGHNGNNPPNEEAVLPFFATPQEGADYVEFMEARKAVSH